MGRMQVFFYSGFLRLSFAFGMAAEKLYFGNIEELSRSLTKFEKEVQSI